MKAIILAGGEGTRLRPLTYKIPKALIPVQGRTLTEQVLDIYKKIGVVEIYLSVSYMSDKVKDYFGDGKNFGLKIKYLEEPVAMGTAGPLIILKQKGEIPSKDFFMCNGDNLFSLDLEKMLNSHQKNKAIATIGLTVVKDPSQFGIANLSGDKILEFIEKPDKKDAPSEYASSGYYILSPKIFDYLPDKNFVMLEKDIWPQLARAGKLFGFCSDSQWFDTGTPERYKEVEANWRGV